MNLKNAEIRRMWAKQQRVLANDKEVFKVMKPYDNYLISNIGRIIKKENKHLMSPSVDREGYMKINLTDRVGMRHTCMVHRLVAQTFLPNDKNLPQINHKNEVRWDNRVKNLEWCDAIYNMNYGKHSQHVSQSNKKPRAVMQFTLDGTAVRYYKNANTIQRELGISARIIGRCCKGIKKTYKNYIWRYADRSVTQNLN